ncbi:MAG: Bug family tripartite tricarboxylate transporter substrate binding protein [Chloroflexota bacterium]
MRAVVRLVLVLAMVASVLAGGCAAAGPKYPEKAINVIVPNPPGGLNDLTARALGESLKAYLPQPFTVVNKAGGNGGVGMGETVQAKADGYTLCLTYTSTALVLPQMSKVPYGAPADYALVAKVTNAPLVFAVQADKPWKNLKEAVDYAKANQGKFRVGTPGVGSIHHMALETWNEKTTAGMVHVPFAGGAESSAALLGGHIEGVIIPPSVITGHVAAGKLKVLGVLEEKRMPLWPNVPTFKESGFDVVLGEYQMILGPKGMPAAAITTLNDAIKKAVETEAFKKFALDGGYVVDYKNAADVTAQMEKDYKTYGDIVKKLGLQQK